MKEIIKPYSVCSLALLDEQLCQNSSLYEIFFKYKNGGEGERTEIINFSPLQKKVQIVTLVVILLFCYLHIVLISKRIEQLFGTKCISL